MIDIKVSVKDNSTPIIRVKPDDSYIIIQMSLIFIICVILWR